ncbi:DEAD/DEAH box helicase [Cyclobacteriaceae bacterium]|nr:DEAD/DEAH box helicase [Cyclobacteriaceae bacterium]
MATFSELGVSKKLIQGAEEFGITNPTEIQERSIPFLLNKREDFVGQAQTGTGKTAAFGLPLLQNIDPNLPKVQALIIAPTRELGQQIAKHLFKYTKYLTNKVFVESVYGGEHIARQMERLERPTHIVVATPGRLLDLVQRKAVDVSAVKTIVLDEADEMLSMGFQKDVEKILSLPKEAAHIWMFSATMPKEVKSLISNYLDAQHEFVQVNSQQRVNPLIEHQFYITTIDDKVRLLIEFIRSQGAARGVVFCKTKAGAQKLAKQIASRNYTSDAIHGDLTQKERDKVMRAFKNKKLQVLVATDVAARGIDVDNLSYVIHYQLPEQLENYTHRAGRTGRAGKRGISIAFILNSEMDSIRQLEKKLKIEFSKVR